MNKEKLKPFKIFIYLLESLAVERVTGDFISLDASQIQLRAGAITNQKTKKNKNIIR